MESMPVTYSFPGLPARFGNVTSGLAFSVSHTITGPTNGTTYVVLGIDYYAGPTAAFAAGSYNINGVGDLYVWHETIDLAEPDIAYDGHWRGAIPLGDGDTLTYKSIATIPADLGAAAWGIVVPAPAGFIS